MHYDTLGIIGGTGWLGRAIAQAVLDAGVLAPAGLMVSNRSGGSDFAPGVRQVVDNRELVGLCDVVMLSIRPEQFPALDIDARGKTVISLMAGVSAATISARTGARVVVRAMPNAAVGIRRSFTPWYVAGELSDPERDWIQRLFECVGTAGEVPDEPCIDYLSALSGTGPAFPALLYTALAHQAVAAGIPEDIARQAAHAVIVGGGEMLATHDPQQMLDTLMAYRGVTAAALQSMADQDFESMIGQALQAGAAVARRGM
ncbi:pyrroline-5-carboxylate reductase dimerization domain-containing protein [Xanthomonas sp. WHRI 1810A]|uniref:pyrroline-5-carboxylate reductase family protein n=1 Tax=Xanthomonas sp. WHRI 1810A TaxID=3161565 RepID=UPI0032E8F974